MNQKPPEQSFPYLLVRMLLSDSFSSGDSGGLDRMHSFANCFARYCSARIAAGGAADQLVLCFATSASLEFSRRNMTQGSRAVLLLLLVGAVALHSCHWGYTVEREYADAVGRQDEGRKQRRSSSGRRAAPLDQHHVQRCSTSFFSDDS